MSPLLALGDAQRNDAQADALGNHLAQAFERLHADAQGQRLADSASVIVDVFLHGVAGREADEGFVQDVAKMHASALREPMFGRHDQRQVILGDWLQVQLAGLGCVRDEAGFGQPGGDGSDDFSAGAFLQFDMQARALGQPGRQFAWQEFSQGGGVGIQTQGAEGAAGEVLQFSAQQGLLTQDQARMMSQGVAGLGGAYPRVGAAPAG